MPKAIYRNRVILAIPYNGWEIIEFFENFQSRKLASMKCRRCGTRTVHTSRLFLLNLQFHNSTNMPKLTSPSTQCSSLLYSVANFFFMRYLICSCRYLIYLHL